MMTLLWEVRVPPLAQACAVVDATSIACISLGAAATPTRAASSTSSSDIVEVDIPDTPVKSPSSQAIVAATTPLTAEMPLTAKVPVNPELLRAVWDDNRAFILDRYIFNDDYFEFIWSLVNFYNVNAVTGTSAETCLSRSLSLFLSHTTTCVDEADPMRSSTFELATRFFTEVFVRFRDNFMFFAWVRRMHQLFRSNVQVHCAAAPSPAPLGVRY